MVEKREFSEIASPASFCEDKRKMLDGVPEDMVEEFAAKFDVLERVMCKLNESCMDDSEKYIEHETETNKLLDEGANNIKELSKSADSSTAVLVAAVLSNMNLARAQSMFNLNRIIKTNDARQQLMLSRVNGSVSMQLLALEARIAKLESKVAAQYDYIPTPLGGGCLCDVDTETGSLSLHHGETER